jgi:hypothetical protein
VLVGNFWKPYIGQAVSGRELCQSDLSYCTRHLLLPIHEASKNAQITHIYPEDGNFNVCQDAG